MTDFIYTKKNNKTRALKICQGNSANTIYFYNNNIIILCGHVMMYTAAFDGDATNYFTEIGRNKKV